jgi:hypothetical protein
MALKSDPCAAPLTSSHGVVILGRLQELVNLYLLSLQYCGGCGGVRPALAQDTVTS